MSDESEEKKWPVHFIRGYRLKIQACSDGGEEGGLPMYAEKIAH